MRRVGVYAVDDFGRLAALLAKIGVHYPCIWDTIIAGEEQRDDHEPTTAVSDLNSERTELARLAEQWISLWNPPVDWALFDALHASEFEDAAAAGRPSTKAGFAQGLRAFAEAFPDLRTTVEDLVVEVATGKVAVRWSAVGTNRGRYLGIGPTQRVTRINGIEIIELRGGQIVRRWGEWDISDHAQR